MEKRIPEVGDILNHKVRLMRTVITAEVIDVDLTIPSKPRITVRANGKTFRSLSSAAKSFNGHEVNGWEFWGLKKQAQKKHDK